MPCRFQVELYQECCAHYGVKPNKDIIEQINKPGFLTVDTIDASRTFLGELGVKALLNFVDCHSGIQRLILVKNGMNASCVDYLCSVLRHSSYLSYIDVSRNPVTTPSARQIWETVRAVPTIREVKAENCGIDEEWMHRLDRCCKANDELQRLGFHVYGPERPLQAWEAVFIIVIGPNAIVEKYSADIVPYVSSFMSSLRLRLALFRIEETDTPDAMRMKVQRCREKRNYNLSWCIVLLDRSSPCSEVESNALMAVLQQEKPIIQPLRNKLGVARDPVYRCVNNLFVYDLTHMRRAETEGAEAEREGKSGVVYIPANVWLPLAGITDTSGIKVPPAVGVTSKSCWKVRCQTDLCAALSAVFSEKPRSKEMLMRAETQDRYIVQLTEKEKHIFSLYPKCKEVSQYIESPSDSATVPLIIFSADADRNTYILSWAASKYGSWDSMRVIWYPAEQGNRSLVVFFHYLLQNICSAPKRVYISLEELCHDVHKAISEYKEKTLLLLVPCLDTLDSCGTRHSLALDWLPSTLPNKVRVIVTLNTESSIFGTLRKRRPQPFDVLNTPLPTSVRAELFAEELSRRMNEVGAGQCKMNRTTRQLELWNKSLENAFLEKEGSLNIVFAVYAASYLQRLPEDVAEQSLALIVSEKVPDTVDEMLTGLLHRYEELAGSTTVQYIVTCLAITPLPISELIFICEELGPCPRQRTLPTLIMLSDDGLVNLRTDCVIHLACSMVRNAAMSLYGDLLDTVSVLVETHFYRLIRTKSPDMSFCFRQLGSIMIANGNFDSACELVLNTAIVDAVLTRDKTNALYLLDTIFRLLNAYDILAELGDTAYGLADRQEQRKSRSALLNALKDIQTYDCFFFQSTLLKSDSSPYHVQSMNTAELPYTVLVPLNTAGEESASHSMTLRYPPMYIHLRGEYLVVTTTQEVLVYSTADFDKIVAKSNMPFELNQNVRGALIAAGTRAIIITDKLLLLWDFSGHSFALLEDTTASLSDDILDTFGLQLIVRHPSNGRLSIVDVSKKHVVTELQEVGAPLREAFFFGHGILALALYDLFIIKGSKVIKLAHSGVIRCVCFPSDDCLIASSVNEDIWTWSADGQLLHLIRTGMTPVEDLCFSTSGAFLLSRQHEGMKVWRSLNGKFVKKLEQTFDEITTCCFFTEDETNIISQSGPYIALWDAILCRPLGAITCSSGVFTLAQERNRMLITATSKKEVKIWRLDGKPLSSTDAAKEKPLTSQWRRNGKVSRFAIIRLLVDFTGVFLAIIDERNTLFLQRIDGNEPLMFVANNVHSVAFFGGSILYTEKQNGRCFYCKSICGESAEMTEIYTPADAHHDASLELTAQEGSMYLVAISNLDRRPTIYLFNVTDWSPNNQLVGHIGPVLCSFLVDTLLFTIGQDGVVRLWSLLRHAERTSYAHSCPIVSAARTMESIGAAFYFIDANLRLFHVHAENISSTTGAAFVVTQVTLLLTTPQPTRMTQVLFVSDLLVLSDEEGSVYLVDIRHGGAVSKLPNYKCLCVAASLVGPDVYVITGHTTGEVILHQVRFAG
uniref:Guanine nucleotide-binding protein subunit beta-like protein n=1 Tax=Trypanosoma vivax (strain Y486) TaxID=1055687 RepID=G0TWG1_TRYVY|nr:conserved hypothetical protein [Trypanosoma vivax Y486]